MKQTTMKMMKLALYLLVGATACGQIAQTPSERLHDADLATSLEAPTDSPWHLKIVIELFDPKGVATEHGTIERWWASDGSRTVISSDHYSATEVRNEQGIFRTPDQDSMPISFQTLVTGVVHPLPSDATAKESQLGVRKKSVGSVQLDCIMLSQKIGTGLKNGRLSSTDAPLGLFPTYCLEQPNILRMFMDASAGTLVLNRIGKFMGRSVAVDINLKEIDGSTAKAHVDRLAAGPEADGHFNDITGLVSVSSQTLEVKQDELKPFIVSRPDPIYPDSAKAGHLGGTVIINATFGRDGRVRNVQLKQIPSPDLAISALQAVRQWKIKPYLVNGIATEVQSNISVNFTIF